MAPRLQKCQLGEAAPIQGQLCNGPLLDQVGQHRLGRLHQWSLACDRHSLGDFSDAKGKINDCCSSQRELEPASDGGLKAGQGSLNLVITQGQIERKIPSLIIAHH